LLDPTRSAKHRYIYTRAHERLKTHGEFTMNCWQFVLLYLRDCHGLTFDDIREMYARIQTGMRVPDFFHGTNHTTRATGCVVCYVKYGVVCHTEIVKDIVDNIGICWDVVAIEPRDDPSGDIFYLDPIAVVSAIRQNILKFAENPLATIDNISTVDDINQYIADGDNAINALITAEAARYAADIPADVIASSDACVCPWYTADQIDACIRNILTQQQIPAIRKAIVDKIIADCI
jgi:hypothetical protein